MIFAITGPDAFLVRAAVREITNAHDPDGLNTSVIDARSAKGDEIATALGTPGFFGGTRIVIVNDLMTLASKGAATSDDDESERPASKSAVDWQRLFEVVRPENVAIFVDRELRGIPAAVKRAMPSTAKVIAGEPPRGSELVAWMKARAKAADSSLSDMTARALAELLCPSTWNSKPANPAYDRPPDLDHFAGEIDKLALAAFPGSIESGHIQEMTTSGQADRLFPLVDAVIASEGTVAIRELGVALAQVDDAPRIAAQLNQQAELLAVMSTAGSTDPVEVGRALGLSNPNRMLAIGKSLRRHRGGARPLLNAALETEREMKTGVLRQPADGVYSLVERVLALGRQTREGGT